MYVDGCQIYFKFQASDSANTISTVNNPDKIKLSVVGLPHLTNQLPSISLCSTR